MNFLDFLWSMGQWFREDMMRPAAGDAGEVVPHDPDLDVKHAMNWT